MIKINNEPFSLMKFFAGFGNWGKVLFILVLFVIFSLGKEFITATFQKKTEIQQVGTFIEAPVNKHVSFFGIKVARIGLGVIYEK